MDRILFIIVTAILLIGYVCQPTCGSGLTKVLDEDFSVGDQVEFDFMGSTRTGEITRFTGTDWPYVEFEYRGETKERFFPPNRLKLISPAEPEKPDAKMRVWTDSTGDFTVKAKLLSDENGKVELKKEDGRIVTLAHEMLSDDDNKFLARLASEADEANPFAGGVMADDDNPFAGGVTRPKKGTKAKERKTPADKKAPPRKPKPSASKPRVEPEFGTNRLGIAAGGWNVKPIAATPKTALNRAVSFRSQGRLFAPSSQFSLIPGTQQIAAMYGSFGKLGFILADLESGNVRSLSIRKERAELFASAPDAESVVLKIDGRGGASDSLEFWDVSGGLSRSNASWSLANFHDRNGFDPEFGAMLDKNRMLTFGRRIILWDCETATDQYTLDIKTNTAPVFTHDGKQFACAVDDGIVFVEAASGKVLGMLSDKQMQADAMAISESGQFLVAGYSKTELLVVWDLNSGQPIAEFVSPDRRVSSLHWVGDRHLLVNDRHLMDMSLQTTVWEYKSNPTGKVVQSNDGRFWFLTSKKVTPISLMTPEIEEKTAAIDPDELLVLQPGDSVAVEIKLPFPRDETQRLRKNVAKQLEDKELIAKDGSPIRLVMSVERLKPEELEVSSLHDPFGRRGTETIKYTPCLAKAELMRGEEVLWSRSNRYGPGRGHIIHSQQGETTQQAAKRMCQPDVKFFQSVSVPQYLRQLPPGMKGESTISESGIQ